MDTFRPTNNYSINNSIMYRFLHENKLPEITRSAVISIIIINAYIMDVYKFTMISQLQGKSNSIQKGEYKLNEVTKFITSLLGFSVKSSNYSATLMQASFGINVALIIPHYSHKYEN